MDEEETAWTPPLGCEISKTQEIKNGPSHNAGNPVKANENLTNLFAHHIESFNFFLDKGLGLAVSDITPVYYTHNGADIKFWLEDVTVGYPTKSDDTANVSLYPSECREKGGTYGSQLVGTICRQVNDGAVERLQKKFGLLPIMVKSSHCHLQGLSPKELIKSHEEGSEQGGYFICNGIERLVRMLQIPRRNYVNALTRPSFQKRGSQYSDKACTIRCVRPDHSAITITLHYLHDGNAMIRFSVRKQEFFIPIVLLAKALVEVTDRELYEKCLRGDVSNTFLSDRLELILRDAKKFNLYTKKECLSYIGSRFRILLQLSENLSDEEVGAELLSRYVFVHLTNNEDKLQLLIHMLRKLYSFVAGEAAEDNADSLNNQEILLCGHLFTAIMKEKFEEFLQGVKISMMKDAKIDVSKVDLHDGNYFKKICDRQLDIGKKFYYFLATGNLVSTSGLDLMQVSGFTIVAEKLNYLRYLSHFRSVHRGQFFTEMKTTTVRKLLPESWGFMCPVHTPDGAPCGLLNHLAAKCKILSLSIDVSTVATVLASLGMTPSSSSILHYTFIPVLLDGRVIGGLPPNRATEITNQLRLLKAKGERGISNSLEICLALPVSGGGCTFPGLYLASEGGRMVRPVRHLASGKIEMIGPMEQVFMDIACVDADRIANVTTHMELDPVSMLSFIASLTPFSDFNQSPRNMYQCQMGKQTMGTPGHALQHRTDNKMYRIQNPQSPLVQNFNQGTYTVDDYPNGTNAIVVVISYTGYDMEDAMILNKSSVERGFGHGTVYKTEVIDLIEEKKTQSGVNLRFGKPPPSAPSNKDRNSGVNKGNLLDSVGDDGLPPVGLQVTEGDSLYCYINEVTGKPRIGKHKSAEPAVVDQVRLLGVDGGGELQKVSIKMRYNRNPVVGDKFSSRHGQKGVLSVLWPQGDMPFSESGISPDVLINPHAFPSRMTIGMLIESMAGKAGAMHGTYQDSTPFKFHEKHRAVDYFGEQLVAAGYNYYGSEPMYSGITGVEMHADIFMGVVYYQRLRHMVSDKSQVRSTGPVNNLTRQPVKGRKKGGGIRFGEMERDSLLAHGAAYLLHDRLMNSSDKHFAHVCTRCGSMLSPIAMKPFPSASGNTSRQMRCQSCNTSRSCAQVAMPYVFRFLANELAAMNIRITLTVKSTI